jgi:hypothetical protein
MTPARLPSAMLVGALIRRANVEGGSAMLLARGDHDSGAIIVLCSGRGVPGDLVERTLTADGYRWTARRVADRDDYVARQRARDPDLWVVELDIADAERFALESFAQV